MIIIGPASEIPHDFAPLGCIRCVVRECESTFGAALLNLWDFQREIIVEHINKTEKCNNRILLDAGPMDSMFMRFKSV